MVGHGGAAASGQASVTASGAKHAKSLSQPMKCSSCGSAGFANTIELGLHAVMCFGAAGAPETTDMPSISMADLMADLPSYSGMWFHLVHLLVLECDAISRRAGPVLSHAPLC